jgi:predicted negative regulator of RcsB-dependent stress response
MTEEYMTDDEQLEVVKRHIKEYGVWIVGGVVLGVGLLFGWRYYQSHLNAEALAAAGKFGEMTTAIQANDFAKSHTLADGIIKDFPSSPYADQAQLALAGIAVDGGKPADAVAPLTLVMNNAKDADLRQIARLRLARVLIDQGKPDDAIKMLAEGTPGGFAGRYHEVRGDALNAKKDTAGAIAEYKAAMSANDGGDGSLLELKITDLGSNEKAKP